MGDAVISDLVELPMQRDRIRRRQRAVDGALRRHQPDGADAGGGMAEPLPDLARERGDRGLAAGAGDGGDRLRVAADKNLAAASASARRAFGVTTNGTRSSPVGAWSPAIATAPEAMAESMKREPSVLLPASAKNTSPGFTARLSTARPFTTTASACGSIAASSLKRSRSLMVFQSGRRSSARVNLRLTGLSSMPQE